MKNAFAFLITVALLFSTSSESPAQAFEAVPVAVKPAGILLLMDGAVFCWQNGGHRVDWHRREVPRLPDPHALSVVDWMQAQKVPGHEGECYLRIARYRYLSVDESGAIVCVEKPDERSRWTVKQVGGRTTGDGDKITEYEFASVHAFEGKRHLAMADNPRILKDKGDNDQKFYAMILASPNKAARFLTFEVART